MEEIIEGLRKAESEEIELKKSTSQLERALKAICAFLNHKGGKVYFGIAPDRKIVGQEVSDQTLKTISQKIRQKIKPEINPEIKVLEIEGRKIIEVKVDEGRNKPYYLDGIPYKRVGNENPIISPEELKKIILKREKVYWDEEICEEASLENIDWEFVKWYKEKYEFIARKKIYTPDEDLLKALGCIKVVDGEFKPTNGGILAFGKDSQKFFPQAKAIVAVYPSAKVGTRHVDIKEISGNLIRIVDEVDEFIRRYLSTFSYLKEGKLAREEIPQYPYFVVRELLINAVVHRDYALRGAKVIIKIFKDRIEYQSPGPLPEGITPENIVKEVFHRNPVLMGVFSSIKYVEEIGEGWDRIMEEVKSHPLKPKMPNIENPGRSVIVTIFSPEGYEYVGLYLNERQRKALEYIKEKGKITRREYIELTKVSQRQANKDIDILIKKNLIVRYGKGRSVYYSLRT